MCGYAELLFSSFIFHNLAKNAKYRSDTRFTKWNNIQDYIISYLFLCNSGFLPIPKKEPVKELLDLL